MTDLIKRDDALALCDRYPYVEGVKSALEDLPAIDPAAIRKAALQDRIEELEAYIENAGQAMSETSPNWEARCHAIMTALNMDFGGYSEDLPEVGSWFEVTNSKNLARIEELVMERDMLRDFDDHFRSMCGFKRDGRSSIECFDDFLAGINKQDIPLPFDHFLQVQKERDEALAKLNKAVKWFKKLDRRGDIWEFFDPFVHKVVTAALAELKGQE